jgi:uncharacterized protein (TIGR02246 family)
LRLTAALLPLFLAAAAQAAPPDAEIRALVERQQRAWNAADTAAYFSAFAPDAVFVDQARSGNTITPYGRATLKAAQVQTHKFLATSKSAETGQVKSVQVTGERAGALSSVVSTRESPRSGSWGSTRPAPHRLGRGQRRGLAHEPRRPRGHRPRRKGRVRRGCCTCSRASAR